MSRVDVIERLNAALEGRYRVERELGRGGMATVYLAADLRHDRGVALKVLKPELAAVVGAERFLAEIRTTANLQHPHILPLFDSGEADGFLFYVMPYVEGESLRERLSREKELPVDEALRIARAVASGLDYAHRNGVIHRDIKPANILIHDGEPLLADFGIALAVQEAGEGRITETGLSLGTPYYMSPEQASTDRTPDARSDVYSLGCVLYEMLAGSPPHTGSSAQAVLTRVLTEDPEPVRKHRGSVPAHVEAALARALQRLPADRFGSAADFGAALDPASAFATGLRVRPGRVQSLARRILWPAAFAVAVLVALLGWLDCPASLDQPPTRLAVPLPNIGGASTSLQRQIALTPDGGTLILTAVVDGPTRTIRRDLSATGSTVLPGVVPFLSDYFVSPDGSEFIGSVAGDRFYRYSIAGGTSKPLPSEIAQTQTLAWAGDGSIWISAGTAVERGVGRLDPSGTLTRPFGPETSDLLIQQVLPGDRTALVVETPRGAASGPVRLLDLESGATTGLLDQEIVQVRYTAGHLVYVLQDGILEAIPFDPDRLRLTGEPVAVAEGVSVTGSGVAQFSVAANGTIAYIPEEPRSLVLVDRDGRSRPATPENRNFHSPRFSPDGRQIAVDYNTSDGRDVWILSLDPEALTRATFDRDGHDPVWTPDGRGITYLKRPPTRAYLGVFQTRAGSIDGDSLIASPELTYTGIWLSDGSALVTTADAMAPDSRSDIAMVTNAGRGPIEPIVATRFEEQHPAVSPDDRWLAYVSDQSGSFEVYVRPLRGEGDQVQVSLDGGTEPVWGPDGRELFYRTGPAGGDSELIAANIAVEPRLAVTSRRTLFAVDDIASAIPHSNYDISPDGRTFVMVRFNPASRVMVIQNLPALVRKLSGQPGGGT